MKYEVYVDHRFIVGYDKAAPARAMAAVYKRSKPSAHVHVNRPGGSYEMSSEEARRSG